MKKFLTALFIGAFVFGVGTTNIQTASAAGFDKVGMPQEKIDMSKDNHDGDKSNRPEPPKDANGKPMAPPNHDGDNSNRPEPPKDANGKPMAPPNHDGDNSNRPEPPKDSNGNPMPPPNHDGDKSNVRK